MYCNRYWLAAEIFKKRVNKCFGFIFLSEKFNKNRWIQDYQTFHLLIHFLVFKYSLYCFSVIVGAFSNFFCNGVKDLPGGDDFILRICAMSKTVYHAKILNSCLFLYNVSIPWRGVSGDKFTDKTSKKQLHTYDQWSECQVKTRFIGKAEIPGHEFCNDEIYGDAKPQQEEQSAP